MKAPPLDLRKHWLQLAFLAVPLLAITAEWDRFPVRLATPWLCYGQTSGWATKTVVLLFFPLLNVVVALLLAWLPRFDPMLRRDSLPTQMPGIKSPGTISSSCAAVLAFISFLVAVNALGYDVNGPRLAVTAALGLLAIVGNFMGTLRQNYFFGLRTPWTLKNSEVWRATHRIGGPIVVIIALALFVLQFVLSPLRFMIAIYILIGMEFAWAFLYSYWRFRFLTIAPSPTGD